MSKAPRLALVLLTTSLFGQTLQSGRNTVMLRGEPQDVFYYPAHNTNGKPERILLFLSGDGGWRGFAVDIAQAAAEAGCGVMGWDTKKYLTGFTGRTVLTEGHVMSDFRAMQQRLGHGRRVLVGGWSEGAGLSVLGATAPGSQEVFAGLLLVGLPDHAFLGWKFADNLTYFTKKDPDEPQFLTAPHLAALPAIPVAMIFSKRDEYTSLDITHKLFNAARDPKRLLPVEARNHRFDGGRDDFRRALKDSLQWMPADR